jgi:hypothetical protein
MRLSAIQQTGNFQLSEGEVKETHPAIPKQFNLPSFIDNQTAKLLLLNKT